MKPDAHKLRQQSTLGVGIRMSIDESATAHIMDVLTKLYANPLLAVIREYSTNAWDSHIEAGNTQPIEVTLPTVNSSVLVITDYGVGMDSADIEETYSRYGTSTKRGSNDAVGMLGLGCKSALAYCDQFTLVGRKNGVETTVLVGKDEDGGASMTPVDARPFSTTDGVTIQVPIRPEDVREANELAERFFRFWPAGSVLLNGEEPCPIGRANIDPDQDALEIGNLWLDDQTLLTTDEDVTESLVVMGGVPYPLVDGEPTLFESGNRGQYASAWNAVVFVPIGAVNFQPSRESLMDTKRTRDTLDQARAHIQQTLELRVREQIAGAKDAREAQQRLRDGNSLGVNLTDAQWNGRTVLLKLDRVIRDSAGNGVYFNTKWADVDAVLEHTYLCINHSRFAKKSGERTQAFDLGNTDWHIIVGFDGKALTNVKRAKLELFMQGKGHSHLPKIMAVHKLTADEKFWLKGWKTWKWDDIAAVELPKQVAADGTTTRLKGSYDCLIDGSREPGVAAAKIAEHAADGKALYWVHGNQYVASSHRAFREGALTTKNAVVVCLGSNRIDKFKRDFPAAKAADDAAKEAAQKWLKTLDPETVKAYSIQQSSDVDVLALLDPLMLADPELVKLHALAKKDASGITSGLQQYGRWVTLDGPKGNEWADKILARYPLLSCLTRYDVAGSGAKEHTVLYLNSAYAARKGA